MKVNKNQQAAKQVSACRRDRRGAERRKSRDLWAHLFIFINYCAWAGLMLALILFHKAQPEFITFFDRFYQLNLRPFWDTAYVRYLVYTAAAGFAMAVAGGTLSLFRARRRTDHRIPIIVLGVLYFLLMVLSWILL